jgi:2-polyprenyl-3-methyl-5-hydroxy-6-metoxy-1,4-benzoquinol methylase
LPLSKHFTNYSETKKIWIILQLIYSSGRCKADICDLPFEDNQYDVILCNHVLEHIPDDTKAMQELYRVLKPGGMAILQIPQELSRAVTFLMIQ